MLPEFQVTYAKSTSSFYEPWFNKRLHFTQLNFLDATYCVIVEFLKSCTLNIYYLGTYECAKCLGFRNKKYSPHSLRAHGSEKAVN